MRTGPTHQEPSEALVESMLANLEEVEMLYQEFYGENNLCGAALSAPPSSERWVFTRK